MTMQALRQAIEDGKISLMGVMAYELKDLPQSQLRRDRNSMGGRLGETTPLNQSYASIKNTEFVRRLESLLKPIFRRYDTDSNGCLDIGELSAVFKDMGEHISSKKLQELFAKFDIDGNGVIDYGEFVLGTTDYIISQGLDLRAHDSKGVDNADNSSTNFDADESTGAGTTVEDDAEEDIPEDLAHLSPAEQQTRIKFRAALYLIMGSALVLLFSDPMVDVFSEIADRTNTSPFITGFLFAPLASNVTEVIASYSIALRKTPSSIAVSLSTLLGAACMNNTFVLGVLLFLVYAQGLVWQYFAETFAILFVQVAVAWLALREKNSVMDGLIVLSLYPISLWLVSFLESMGWD